jgi:hypothetical protein
MGDRSPNEANAQKINKHTQGMIFLGTPFEGSNKANWTKKCRQIIGLFMETSKKNLEDLEKGSSTLYELGDAFPTILSKREQPGSSEGRIQTAFFYEQFNTNGLMVSKELMYRIIVLTYMIDCR